MDRKEFLKVMVIFLGAETVGASVLGCGSVPSGEDGGSGGGSGGGTGGGTGGGSGGTVTKSSTNIGSDSNNHSHQVRLICA